MIRLFNRVVSRFDALVTLDIENDKAIKGVAFSARKRFTLDSTPIVLIFDPTGVPSNKKVVFLPLQFEGIGGRVEIDIFNGITESGDGTIIPCYNRSFVIGTPCKSKLTYDPTTVDTTGLVPIELLLPSDGSSAAISSGAQSSDSMVIDIDITKKLMVRMTNIDSPSTVSMGVKADFFEVLQ